MSEGGKTDRYPLRKAKKMAYEGGWGTKQIGVLDEVSLLKPWLNRLLENVLDCRGFPASQLIL